MCTGSRLALEHQDLIFELARLCVQHRETLSHGGALALLLHYDARSTGTVGGCFTFMAATAFWWLATANSSICSRVMSYLPSVAIETTPANGRAGE